MSYIISHISIALVFLLLSAFFSGTETALFSLKKADLHRLSISEKSSERAIATLMNTPDRILATILIGNLFVNLSLAAIVTNFLLGYFGNYGHFISISVVTPLIIILSEITPKVIAVNTYLNFSRASFPLILLFHKIFYPARFITMKYTDLLTRIFKLDLTHANLTEEELRFVVNTGEEKGLIDKRESDIIKNVMRFSDKEASNIMYPRNQATFIQYGSSIEQAMEIIIDNELVRIPVYKEDYDDIVGFIDSRDLMASYLGYKKNLKINKFIKPIDFFPFSKVLTELLEDFLKKKIQIAVIVDEYGGTAGIVTLSSILSSLLGKEFGKWENYKKSGIRLIDQDRYIVSGKLQLDEFNLFFNEKFTSNNSDTIGGYVIEQLNFFPTKGEKIQLNDIEITVKTVSKRKIMTLDVYVMRTNG
ncbi:MAG TPA: hemolysin family protein [Spirochaetota bacterium]|nr:hemolysin family protein [Spirochaetota bacterium]HPF05869.1 hemolysin family protein [Spirochaetota bacterium]HPJ40708.1 hemolysin family protein [Spirochaetota bacterium]HPR35977.1 hemolysin family protein [Spirochaetota bacterium]HRX45891.1 hemolysin family protein [Spirochaetota bacterium]